MHEQLKLMQDACKPVPYMIVGGYAPPSPQENANAAWRALGEELGFDSSTVRPVPGESAAVFEAAERDDD